MPTITIKGVEHPYDENDVITFPEGLIGLPQVKQAVVITMNGFEPFCWLAPIGIDALRFVVVDPNDIFNGYQLQVPGGRDSGFKTYSLVTLSSDWTKTTFNLKAPIFVDQDTRKGSQQILNDSPYHFAETLPQDQ